MESTIPLQIADVVAWGRNRLGAGLTSERDGVNLYATAVNAAATLTGVHRQVDEKAPAESIFREEGAEMFNRQPRTRRA
jgi:hypothetical protein